MKRSLNFKNDDAKLYLVATPIGNLKELSPRAIEILNEVDIIACEDTRVTKPLLLHFDIHKEMIISLHEHNERVTSEKIIQYIVDEHKNVAYVSDQGYPTISDPGHILVKKALENEINVVPISGPSAFLNALVGSGLDATHFYFHGFLDAKEKARREELLKLKNREETLIFYEAPHRLAKCVLDMYDVLGDRKACIARELTKIHEEFIRGNLKELSELTAKEQLKGEFVIVIEGADNEQSAFRSDEEIVGFVNSLIDVGLSTKDAIERASEQLKIKKNYIYKLYHRG